MASISIVVRDADGTTVETCHDSAADKEFAKGGYSGARRAFAAKKFDKNVKLATATRSCCSWTASRS